MANPSTITQWLAQPDRFSPADRQELAVMLQSYPYFVPARYMQAAEQQKTASFAPPMMEQMQLYKGNWMLFHQFLQNLSSIDTLAGGAREQEAITAVSNEKPNEEPDVAAPHTGTVSEEQEELITDDEEFSFEFDEDQLEKLYEASEQKTAGKAISQVPEADKEAYIIEEEIEEEAPVNTDPADIPKPHQPYLPPRKEVTTKKEEGLIQPIYTEDYFLHQGIQVSEDIPLQEADEREDKSLMVVMSFSEWLMHFKSKSEREKEEQKDQKALRTMWQKEKLAAAMEEENEEIPEDVFEMAVNSITREEDLVSESLAEILLKQQKHDKAIDMYKKLSLRNPQKNAYFARKIEEILKEIES